MTTRLLAACCGLALCAVAAEDAIERAKALQAKGALHEALGAYQEALPGLRSGADRARLAFALNQCASIANNLGEYEKAGRDADQAAGLCRALGDARCESQALNTAGLALLYRGQYRQALPFFRSSLDLCRRVGDREREIYRLNNIGNLFLFEGLYLDALRSYQEAEDALDANRSASWHGAARRLTYANLATLFQRLGRDEAALNVYQTIRSLPGELTPSEQARMLANLGALYRRLGDPEKAAESYRAAQALFRRERHQDGEISTLRNMGILLALERQDYPQATRVFNDALRLAEASGNRQQQMQVRLYLGETLLRAGDPRAARREWTASLELARRMGAAEEEWKSRFGLARVAAREGELQEQREHLSAAVSIIESVRARVQVSTLKPEFLSDKREVYDALIESVLREGPNFDAALDLIERARARALQDRLRQAAGSAADLRDVRARIARLYAERLSAPPERIAALDAATTELENEYLRLERRLEERRGAVAGRRWTAAALQERLGPGTLLLIYWMGGGGRAAVLWVSRAGHGLAVRQFDQRAFESAIAALARPGGQASLTALGAALLGAVPLTPQTSQVIIVPDGELARLPFEVLPAGGQRMIERAAVSYLPATELLFRPRPGGRLWRPPWKLELLAFGDPAGGSEGKLLPGDEQWLRLPRSADEVRNVARLVNGRAEIHLGPAAMKRALIGRQARPPLLHLGTHAAADREDPARSRILFAGEPGQSRFDYLFLHEIYGLDLGGVDLATLSACETAAGRAIGGEGVQSLAAAFLAAGARSTVATLWPIPDRATAGFMEQFYYSLRQRQSKAAALRSAKLALLGSGGNLAHPYYWAGFVLSGDGTEPIPRFVTWTQLGLAGAIPLIALAAWSTLRVRAARRRAVAAATQFRKVP